MGVHTLPLSIINYTGIILSIIGIELVNAFIKTTGYNTVQLPV